MVKIGDQSVMLVEASMTQVEADAPDNWKLNPSAVVPAEPRLRGMLSRMVMVTIAMALVAEASRAR